MLNVFAIFDIVTGPSRAIMHSPTPNTWLHNGAPETDLISLAAAASTQAYRDYYLGFKDFPSFESLPIDCRIYILLYLSLSFETLGLGYSESGLAPKMQNFKFRSL